MIPTSTDKKKTLAHILIRWHPIQRVFDSRKADPKFEVTDKEHVLFKWQNFVFDIFVVKEKKTLENLVTYLILYLSSMYIWLTCTSQRASKMLLKYFGSTYSVCVSF